MLVATLLLALVAVAVTVVVARADTVSLKVDTVTVIGVSDDAWRCLLNRGYNGTPDDGMEALSVPLDQLRECARGDTLST